MLPGLSVTKKNKKNRCKQLGVPQASVAVGSFTNAPINGCSAIGLQPSARGFPLVVISWSSIISKHYMFRGATAGTSISIRMTVRLKE
jgi:hypothetical protein